MIWFRTHWRSILAHLPLPMLGLAASYGVYSFALLFVPQFFALAQAAAFELTYIGLAVVDAPELARRSRAARISVAAVAVSVVYNSAAGYFHRNPLALSGLSFWEELGLAVVHGAPLAITAYFVADFLLHPTTRTVMADESSTPVDESAATVTPEPVLLPPLTKTERVRLLASELNISESTVWRLMNKSTLAPESEERKVA